ncbi:MAG: Phytochrome-like protein cph2 [Acidimicrobiia bacterium]|nr:Phytochrome-like protein cph2 [Acidimicrobiia bacterium]
MRVTGERTSVEPIFGRPLRTLFQPIVELESARVVAYEALTRAALDSPLKLPGELFGLARQLGLAAELDWECAATALRSAVDAGLPRHLPLFVNADPASLTTDCPQHLAPVIDECARQLQVVIEVTERALLADPASLLRCVAKLRDLGAAIALDDIGAEPASLALMPFVQPDVMKLDLRLVQQRSTAEVAAIVAAVAAQAERTGAIVLAEGIESEEHLERAIAAGATLGQGWMFGYPEPLPAIMETEGLAVPSLVTPSISTTSPFDAVAPHARPRVVAKHTLQSMSLHMEAQAANSLEPPVLLSAFQHVRHFTPATSRRYAGLAKRCALIAALGSGIGSHPIPGVRGAHLADDDVLKGEWAVTVVGPHFAGALLARDLGDDGPDAQRRFEFVVTHDRALVLEAARRLMGRINPLTV